MFSHQYQKTALSLLGSLIFLSLDVDSSRASVLPALPQLARAEAIADQRDLRPLPPPSSQNRSRREFERHIATAARQHGVSHELIRAVIQTESAFDPLALSERGACGLMQIMPGTARRFGVIDCFDVRENIHAGTRFLKALLTRYDGSIALSMAAYNAGEGAVARHGGIPPYRQTQAYVRKVEELLGSTQSGS